MSGVSASLRERTGDKASPFTTGIQRRSLGSWYCSSAETARFRLSGSYWRVTQSPKSIRENWCPPRRHGPFRAHPLGEYAIRIRSRSSQHPYPPLETVGNDRASEGATATQTNTGGVRACPPWQKGQAGRWHGPCPPSCKRRRSPDTRYRLCGETGYGVLCKRIPRPHGRRTRHTLQRADVLSTNPVLPSWKEVASVGRDGTAVPTPSVRLRNPRSSERGGCQGSSSVTSTRVSSVRH